MKIILFIYLGFTIGCFLFIFLTGLCVKAIYLRRYPNLGLPKRTFAEYLLVNLRTIVIASIPIFNVFMFFYFIFKNKAIMERGLEMIKEEREQEVEEQK